VEHDREVEDRQAEDRDSGAQAGQPPEAGAGGPERYRPDLDEAVEAWRQMGDASLLKGVAAILVGFVVLTLGSVLAGRALISVMGLGRDEIGTPVFLATSLGLRLILAILAGYLTAKAAPRAPLAHAAVLGGILAFLSLAAIGGLSAAGAVQDPWWYPRVMLFVGPIGVVLGGALGSYQKATTR